MAHQPLEADFFPGILEGLVGRLGLASPSVTNPPTSIREGVTRHWAAALREAVRKTGGGDAGGLADAQHTDACHICLKTKPKYMKNRPLYGRIPVDYAPM